MEKTVSIGRQDFEKLRVKQNFYVDKTHFIREWWEADDDVTLITRPRRFGKTLNMSMVEKFFSIDCAGRGELFEGLSIWEDEKYQKLQGTYPVLSLSFADVKERTFTQARKAICQTIKNLYNHSDFLLKSGKLNQDEEAAFRGVSADMEDSQAAFALRALCEYLSRYHEKHVIILLDEYDTPMQEAYVHGYWEELAAFTRALFNATFKTNPYLERAIMTGITRVSRESIFSDLNNIEVVTTTSEKYADSFGFTEAETFAALEEYGLADQKESVKSWYDGFTFGSREDIYNPWSIINFLDKKKTAAYWANSSSNSLVGKLLQEADKDVKQDFELLLRGEVLKVQIDEQIVYNELPRKRNAIWSLLLASGYLKVLSYGEYTLEGSQIMEPEYELDLTNFEVRVMLQGMVRNWFSVAAPEYNDFIKALLLGDIEAMNEYMNRVALATFSHFDTGKAPSRSEPERFYHGFVLGLMVDLAGRYALMSNRESGFGRCDVVLEPLNGKDDAMILEFKVFQPKREASLQETVDAALAQIEAKHYQASLMEKGIPQERIRKYGFAFEGKKVLIGGAQE